MDDTSRRGGKATSWNEDENLTLARVVAIVVSYPAKGANMSIPELGRRI